MQNPCGVLSQNNSYPGANLHVQGEFWKMDIIIHDDRHMTAKRRQGGSVAGQNVYLGVLINETNEEVYWTNDSQPLPEF